MSTGQEIGKGPPSIALALGVWQLAWSRRFGGGAEYPEPVPRIGTHPASLGASSEYYRMIDRIALGEAP